MNVTLAIFQREFLAYFRTPVGYVFLVLFVLAATGLPFYAGDFFESDEASLRIFFQFLPWTFLVFVPAVGMRLWAEEKRAGTEEILLTLPLQPAQAVLGKFLAAWLFLGIALLLTIGLPLTILYLGNPDPGPMFAGYFGAFLMAGTYLAVAMLTSALTRNQIISFIVATTVNLILALLGWNAFSDLLLTALPVTVVDTLANFSYVTHFEPLSLGLIDLRDVAYFVTLAGFCLALNILALAR